MDDLRAQYDEEAVGANHPTKADVINRLVMIEHNMDGTHGDVTLSGCSSFMAEHNADGSHGPEAANPVAAVVAFPKGAPPAGWLECDGSSLSRTTYADLFAVLDTDYGNVDANTFNLPDYRGEFLRGWDHGQGRDPDAASRTDRGDGTVGDYVGTRQADANRAHNHALIHPVYYDKETGGSESWETKTGNRELGVANLATTNSGGNEARPRNVSVMWCIKY